MAGVKKVVNPVSIKITPFCWTYNKNIYFTSVEYIAGYTELAQDMQCMPFINRCWMVARKHIAVRDCMLQSLLDES